MPPVALTTIWPVRGRVGGRTGMNIYGRLGRVKHWRALRRMEGWARQSIDVRCGAWQTSPGKALACACHMADQAGQSIGVHCVAWWAGPGRLCSIMHRFLYLSLLLAWRGEEVWWEDPNQARPYSSHYLPPYIPSRRAQNCLPVLWHESKFNFLG
jgi:hypothetical protein